MEIVDKAWDLLTLAEQEGWSKAGRILQTTDPLVKDALSRAGLIHYMGNMWWWTDQATKPGAWTEVLGL